MSLLASVGILIGGQVKIVKYFDFEHLIVVWKHGGQTGIPGGEL